MVSAIRRCQSKKHRQGGCGAPNCPEGLSIKKAMDDALKDENVSAYLELKGKANSRPVWVSKEAGFIELDYGQRVVVRVAPERPLLKKAVSKLDTSATPSFSSVQEISDFVETEYPGLVDFKLKADDSREWKSLEVRSMYVDADVRGSGIGAQLRRIVVQHAEENNMVVFGDPSPGGDGSMVVTDENWDEFRAKAAEHQKRLIRFYERNGYVLNPCYPSLEYNPDTPEMAQYKVAEQAKLTEDAKAFLRQGKAYLKLPVKGSVKGAENSYPKSMLIS